MINQPMILFFLPSWVKAFLPWDGLWPVIISTVHMHLSFYPSLLSSHVQSIHCTAFISTFDCLLCVLLLCLFVHILFAPQCTSHVWLWGKKRDLTWYPIYDLLSPHLPTSQCGMYVLYVANTLLLYFSVCRLSSQPVPWPAGECWYMPVQLQATRISRLWFPEHWHAEHWASYTLAGFPDHPSFLTHPVISWLLPVL